MPEALRCYGQLLSDLRELLAAAGTAAGAAAGPSQDSSTGWDTLMLEDAAWAAWASNTGVLHAAAAGEVQLLIRVEQACWKCGSALEAHGQGSQAGLSQGQQLRRQLRQGCSAAVIEIGLALSEQMKSTAGSALGSLHLAPISGLGCVAALLRAHRKGGGDDDAVAAPHTPASPTSCNSGQHVELGRALAALDISQTQSGLQPQAACNRVSTLESSLAWAAQAEPREALMAMCQLAALRAMHRCAGDVVGLD